MILKNQVQLWEMFHPGIKYLDECILPDGLDRDALFDYLMREYECMHTIRVKSEQFHNLVVNFFMIHNFNINKLWESTQLDYEPLENFHTEQTLGRSAGRGLESSTVEQQDGNEMHRDNGRNFKQSVNMTSAFNDVKSPASSGTDSDGNPTYTYIDTEKDRMIDNGNYHSDGNREYLDNKDKIHNEEEINNVTELIKKSGNNGQSYQSLIDEERRQAEFNVYKWIGKHFSTELLIHIW